MMQEVRRLAQAIATPTPEKVTAVSEFRTGVVTVASPLTVQLADGTTVAGVKRLSSYTATVSDVVRFEKYGPTLLVLGKIV